MLVIGIILSIIKVVASIIVANEIVGLFEPAWLGGAKDIGILMGVIFAIAIWGWEVIFLVEKLLLLL